MNTQIAPSAGLGGSAVIINKESNKYLKWSSSEGKYLLGSSDSQCVWVLRVVRDDPDYFYIATDLREKHAFILNLAVGPKRTHELSLSAPPAKTKWMLKEIKSRVFLIYTEIGPKKEKIFLFMEGGVNKVLAGPKDGSAPRDKKFTWKVDYPDLD